MSNVLDKVVFLKIFFTTRLHFITPWQAENTERIKKYSTNHKNEPVINISKYVSALISTIIGYLCSISL